MGASTAGEQPAPVVSPGPASVPSAVVEKDLVSHRILVETIGSEITDALARIAGHVERRAAAGDAVEALQQEAEGAREVAERLSRVSGRHAGSYVLLDVNECLDEVVAGIAAQGDRVKLTVEGAAVPEVFASRTEIVVMLDNVLENALEAIEARGNDARTEGEVTVTVARQ